MNDWPSLYMSTEPVMASLRVSGSARRVTTRSRSMPSASASHVVPQYSAKPSIHHSGGNHEGGFLCAFMTCANSSSMYACVSSWRVTQRRRVHEPLCGMSTRPLMSSVSPPTDSVSSSGVALVCWNRWWVE